MDMKMKREFVHVMYEVEDNELVNILGEFNGCSVTEHAGTVTIATQTMDGLSEIIGWCMVNQGEKKINSAFRSLEGAIVEFIG